MRRELRFKNFKDVCQELENLKKGSILTTGQWSYFQILEHCRKSIEGSMKGIQREMTWWKRNVTGPLNFRKLAQKGVISPGIGATPGATVDRIEGNEETAFIQLNQALLDFEKFEGKLSLHPRFGRLSKKSWIHFHAMHLANHLGYATLREKN